MPDRLLAEAARMLQSMEERFGIPTGDIETPDHGDDGIPPVPTHPAGGQQERRLT